MVSVQQVREDIKKFGLPNDDDKVALSLRVLRSTKFFNASTAVTPHRHFTTSNPDTFWNNQKLPTEETAVTILGIRYTHNIVWNPTPVDIGNKIQQMFEEASVLRFKYRRRADRLELPLSLIRSARVEQTGNIGTSYANPGSQSQIGFFALPQSVPLAPKIELEFLLDVPTGFTTGAADATGADATITAPIPGAPSDAQAAIFFGSLQLLVQEQYEAQG